MFHGSHSRQAQPPIFRLCLGRSISDEVIVNLNYAALLQISLTGRGDPPVAPAGLAQTYDQVSTFPLYSVFLRSNFTLTCLPSIRVSNWSSLSPLSIKGVPSGSARGK